MDKLKGIFTKEKKKQTSTSSPSTSTSNEEPTETTADIPVIEVDEVDETKRMNSIEPIIVKSIDLNALVDVQEAGNELRGGNIVILNISPLMDEDPSELKRAVDQLRGIASEINGDVGRLSEHRIIATPELVRIQFKREEI